MHSLSGQGPIAGLLVVGAAVFGGLAPVFAAPLAADRERWLTAHAATALCSTAEGDTVLSLAPQWSSYRLDGPSETLNGRLWVWSPYTRGHGWIPAAAVGPGRRPSEEEIKAFWARIEAEAEERRLKELRQTSPRDYLFARYPDLAPLLDCIATRESGWANVPNRRGSGAFGPFQFLRGTFYSTATGQRGGNWREPADQVDAAVDMVRSGRVLEWEVVRRGLC